jgi:hypothetical protein
MSSQQEYKMSKQQEYKMSGQQEYKNTPTNVNEVQGLSSKTIYKYMTGEKCYVDSHYPLDVDDWERCRALLLCFPEWKTRLLEMSVISSRWKILVKNWDEIENLYNDDISNYGNNAYKVGKCDNYIRTLHKILEQV